MENRKNATAIVAPLSLPKGNGTITGMGESLSGIGSDGMLSLSLPLPISSGRGDAPQLSLNYSSGVGNGPFGMGWSCPIMSITRRSSNGVPLWNDDDEFIGPDGEVLIPEPVSANRIDLRGQLLPDCTVTRYRPRVERTQFLIERWVPQQTPSEDFWVVYMQDGRLCCLGKTAQARIAHPQVAGGTVTWLLEESVNIYGEHQYWQYLAEDSVGCELSEITNHPQAVQRYLSRVFYGNISASDVPFVLTKTIGPEGWLFCLVLDYGEYGSGGDVSFDSTGQWIVRDDCFSDYRYGFDLRTRRLCRQVLMFHNLNALAGKGENLTEMALCSRMSFVYDESAVVTTLILATRYATGAVASALLPPLEFDWQEPAATDVTWLPVNDMVNLDQLPSWQLVDLYGEGVPGVLYQDNHAWWYCSPVRKADGGTTWSVPSLLPVAPTASEHSLLMDITRDGRPDWLVAQPGVQGYFTMDASNNWSSFIPFDALPTEFFHPSAQLQDLTGKGNLDLVLIGPGSVRLWGANDTGWENARDVDYTGLSPLPVLGRVASEAVVFSDLLGSGQQHLARILADSVTVWPSLGHGKFGESLTIPGFNVSADSFNPSRLYLADTDGSGSSDILYVESDRILVFINQNGNRFVAVPPILLPQNVRFDDSCQIQVADLQGMGVASVLLTVSHPRVQRWCCHLNTTKPWLLSAMNNNMGAHHTFTYKSSAQFWLDEKQADTNMVCHLPFPVHTLWQQTTEDEITGNKLSCEARYYQGVWDAREREFRGFAYVEQQDTNQGSNAETDSPSLLTCSWFATGVESLDDQLSSQFWLKDREIFAPYISRMTAWRDNSDLLLPDTDEKWWLQRALKGCLLRSEVYGLDNKSVPFSISEFRWQARRLSDNLVPVPVVMPLLLESRHYLYERIIADPRITQNVNLVFDAEGIPVDTLTINYPRRSDVKADDYPVTVRPKSIVGDSVDEQQQSIHLTRVRSTVFSFQKNDVWRVGLPDKQRTDVIDVLAIDCPDGGFSLENLTSDGSFTSAMLASGGISDWYEVSGLLVGMQQVRYTHSQGDDPLDGEPEVRALVAFTESAVIDKRVFELTSEYLITEDLLTQWGYVKTVDTFVKDTGNPLVIWGIREGYTDYGDATQFWRPTAQQPSLLIGKTQIKWDTHYCLPTEMTDAAGLVTSITDIDYRFMLSVKMTDANDNEHQIIPDDFGRPVAHRFNGMEEGKPVGYSDWHANQFPLNISIWDALKLTDGVPLASFSVIVPDSWMQNVSALPSQTLTEGLKNRLTACSALGQGGQLNTLAWQRYQRRNPKDVDIQTLNEGLTWDGSRFPPCQLDITTDRYDRDSEQQLRKLIRFSDGMGRLLQSSVCYEDGIPDWNMVNDSLVLSDGKTTCARWIVSGKTEYNNKGLPVCTYQPFFLDDWRYVRDDSARQELYADTFFYDAIGRNTHTRTAKQALRRMQYYPWFTISEDENDTAEELSLQSVN